MKTILFTAFLLSSCFILGSASGKKVPDISQKIIKALRDNDTTHLLECYPQPADFDTLASFIKNPEEKENFIAHYKKRFSDKSDAAIENFRQVRAEGIARGIKWSEIKKSDVQYERLVRKSSIKFCDMYIQISSGEDDWWVKLDDCIHSKATGWLILDNIILKDNIN